MVIPATAPDLTTTVLRLGGSLPAVGVFEADDVVEMGRRDLQDGRVLDRRDAVNRARVEVERGTGPDHLLVEHRVPGRPKVELRAPRVDEPRLVLHPVELQA